MMLALRKSGESGVANMKSVENAWVRTMAFTQPILLASGGEAKVATPMTMFDTPRIGPLIVSEMPYRPENHADIRGTISPAPKAMIALVTKNLMRTPIDFLGRSSLIPALAFF